MTSLTKTPIMVDYPYEVQKMAQFEELLNQIEIDKNELFDKISNLEEENEQHLKEKHALKVELIQTKTALTDCQAQLQKEKDHINMLESLNTYKDEEIKEFGDASKESESVRVQLLKSQKTVTELRKELEEIATLRTKFEQQNIQLSEDLAKERDLSAKVKQELKDLKARHQEGYDQKKKDLELSNIAASKMFTYYKMRESINNRLSNLNMPMSFAADEKTKADSNFGMNDLRQTLAGRESTAMNRMSLRNSVVQGRMVLFSKRQSFRSVYQRLAARTVQQEERLHQLSRT